MPSIDLSVEELNLVNAVFGHVIAQEEPDDATSIFRKTTRALTEADFLSQTGLNLDEYPLKRYSVWTQEFHHAGSM